MASSKRLGFFWGEDKITVVEFDKNMPLAVISAPIGAKTNAASPFSSNLTEEIQITAILQKILQDNKMKGGTFYVSLPMKEIILRSFIIPFVKPDEVQSAIKFESKKYMPFDIQDLSFVYHTVPFMEGTTKRLQVIFFAARKEVLARYERIFKQVDTEVAYCEPYMVSLSKVLIFQKEAAAADHLAFLTLDNNIGRICFIDKGIPQFIREFSIKSTTPSEETDDPKAELNSRVVNEVGNSFDFYARQFNGERINQMLITSDFVQVDLMENLESELKLKIKKYSPVITAGTSGQSHDMDAIYAMGACVSPPVEALSGFNLLGDNKPKAKPKGDLISSSASFNEIIYVLIISIALLVGLYIYTQTQLRNTQKQLDLLNAKGAAIAGETADSLQAQVQQNTDLLSQYKAIRTKSDIASIFLRVASHLPQGAMLTALSLTYDQGNANSAHVSIDMTGNVNKEDANQEIAVINQIFSDFKNDKEMFQYFNKVNLVSLNREDLNGHTVTSFNIHCS